MAKNYKVFFILFLSVWFIVNLLQASYTEIIGDEAYYWFYSKFPAWGYFDHPPMVALLIKISSLVFGGNLGIRFMTVVMQTLTILITWKIINEERPDTVKTASFIIIVSSVCIISMYGFITTPDAPLLFFTAFFLFYYKRYLDKKSWLNVLMLSVSVAGLVYSKYQGILLVGFVALSNLRLFKNYKIWASGILSLALITPHLWWQFANDFPTFKFHLVDRSESFRWIYLFEYLPNQMAVFNPLILGAVFFLLIRKKPGDKFTRALYYIIFGFLSFFGLMAFRGHVEPHWTASCSIPMIILLYRSSVEDIGMFRFLRRGVLPTIFILLAFRIMLVSDLPLLKNMGFAGKKAEFEKIESVALDLPVLFSGCYQNPAMYTFFTGKASFGISSLYSRLTQFDIWQSERIYNDRAVYVFGPDTVFTGIHFRERLNPCRYKADSLQTVNRIMVAYQPRFKKLYTNDSVALSFNLTNPYEFDINFNHREFPVEICTAFLRGSRICIFPVKVSEAVGIIRSGEECRRMVSFRVPELPPGRYHFGICLRTPLGPAINNSFSVISIEKR